MSSLPDATPDTLSEELFVEPINEFSQASKPPRRLTRRVTSQPPVEPESSGPQKSPEPELGLDTSQPRPRRVRIP